MKKATLESIMEVLETRVSLCDELVQEVMDEVRAELNKGADAKAKSAEAYEAIHALVIGALSDTPATCAEIFSEIEDELPEGMGKGKIQYALNNLWQDEVVKISGKPNTYRHA